jgi:hypothetical protein
MALDPATREWTTFRLPYPIGSLYTRERGRESRGMVAKFQLRPDPLAH